MTRKPKALVNWVEAERLTAEFNRLRPGLESFVLRQACGDYHLMEDLFQEAHLRLLQYGMPPNPRAWLCTVLRRLAVDAIRSSPPGLVHSTNDLEKHICVETPFLYHQSWFVEQLLTSGLSPKLADFSRMWKEEGDSNRDAIAARLRISRDYVDRQVQLVRNAQRRNLHNVATHGLKSLIYLACVMKSRRVLDHIQRYSGYDSLATARAIRTATVSVFPSVDNRFAHILEGEHMAITLRIARGTIKVFSRRSITSVLRTMTNDIYTLTIRERQDLRSLSNAKNPDFLSLMYNILMDRTTAAILRNRGLASAE